MFYKTEIKKNLLILSCLFSLISTTTEAQNIRDIGNGDGNARSKLQNSYQTPSVGDLVILRYSKFPDGLATYFASIETSQCEIKANTVGKVVEVRDSAVTDLISLDQEFGPARTATVSFDPNNPDCVVEFRTQLPFIQAVNAPCLQSQCPNWGILGYSSPDVVKRIGPVEKSGRTEFFIAPIRAARPKKFQASGY